MVAVVVGFRNSSAQSLFKYAYIIATSPLEARIAIIDPLNPNIQPEYLAIPIPSDWRPPVVHEISPNGMWGIFVSAGIDDPPTDVQNIRFYNFFTGETQDVEPADLYQVLNPQRNSVAWSPNNSYAALNMSHDRIQNDIYIHSLETGNTTNLTSDDFDQREIAWSPVSEEIATLTMNCPTAESCSQAIEIINLDNGERRKSLSLRDVASETLGIGCNLRWSPDGKHLALVMGCQESSSVEREVFLYEINTNSFIQVTNFTSSQFREMEFAEGNYTLEWYDDDTLLIGAMYRIDPNGLFAQQSFMYTPSSKEITSIFEEFTMQWALNSSSNQVAAAIVNVVAVADTAFSNEANVAILTLSDTDNLIQRTESEFLFGCNLAWSPSGNILAYSVPLNTSCLGNVQQLMFVDGLTDTVQEVSTLLEDYSVPYAVVPLGWIRVAS